MYPFKDLGCMYLKCFPTKEVAEAAIAEAMKKLSEAQGELNVNEEEKTIKADTIKSSYYLPPFPMYTGRSTVNLEVGQATTPTVTAGPVSPVPAPGEYVPSPRYTFVPKKDLSVYELAMIINAWRGSPFTLSEKDYESLDYNAKRHFKPPLENPYD